MAKHWTEQREVAGNLLLEITFFLVNKTPRFLLKIIVFIVAIFYFLLLKEQRANIREFRERVRTSGVIVQGGIFSNFYNFALAICDKIAVWTKKTGYEVDDRNLKAIRAELDGLEKGKVLLTSHYGNIEIAKALVSELARTTKINIFMYKQNSAKFNNLMKKISNDKINVFWVDELDITVMLDLKNLIEKGEHIAIMADRIPIKSEKIAKVKFLGKEANFSLGAYLIAGILEAEICSFWSYKIGKKYVFEVVNLPKVVLKKDKIASVMPTLKAYVRDLEEKCKTNPNQWYNFFDFWGQGEK